MAEAMRCKWCYDRGPKDRCHLRAHKTGQIGPCKIVPAGFVERGTVLPSADAQAMFPLAKFPCSRCADPSEGLPFLIDSDNEFHWEHQHESPGSSARTGCPRFSDSKHFSMPRKGSVVPTFYRRPW